MLNNVIDYAFITSILYVYKYIAIVFVFVLPRVLALHPSAILVVVLQWKVLLTFISEY